MKWKKLSDYAIQSGPYTISKALVKGAARFTLWIGEPGTMLAIRDTSEELKKMAEEKSNESALQEG